MTITATPEEVLRAKFNHTLTTIEGYYQEARGDLSVDQGYSANGVYRRMGAIREAIQRDLHNLASSIKLDSDEKVRT